MLQRHVTSSPIPQNYTNRCRQNGGIYWYHLSAQNSPKISGYITPYRAKRDVQCCNVTLRHHQSLKTIPIDAAKMAAYIGTIYPHKIAQKIFFYITPYRAKSDVHFCNVTLRHHQSLKTIPIDATKMAAYIGTIYPHKIAQKYWAILHNIGKKGLINAA